MSEKHIGKVLQVIGPVLDIQFEDWPAAGAAQRHRDRQPRRKLDGRGGTAHRR